MTDELTPQEIAEALAVCEAATPGPLYVGSTVCDAYMDCDVVREGTEEDATVCQNDKWWETVVDGFEREEDAAFFVLAHGILPRALRALQQRAEDTERLEWLIDNRARLWNSQFRDRAAIDAARKEAERD